MYRQNKNDPNRKEHNLSPEEVKRMVMGDGKMGDGEVGSLLEDIYSNTGLGLDEPLIKEIDGVTHVNFPHTNLIYSGPARCPTCGRAFDCACTDCATCDTNGRPR